MRAALLTNSATAAANASPIQIAANTVQQGNLAAASQEAAQKASQEVNRVLSSEKDILTSKKMPDPSYEDRAPEREARGARPDETRKDNSDGSGQLISVA